MGFFLEKTKIFLAILWGFVSPLDVFKKVVKKVFKTVRPNRCDFDFPQAKGLAFGSETDMYPLRFIS